MTEVTTGQLGIPEEHRERLHPDNPEVTSNGQYAERVRRFIAESNPVTMNADDWSDLPAFVERIAEAGQKCVICEENGIDEIYEIRDLMTAFREEGIKVYRLVDNFDIPYTPPFTNEGSENPTQFDGVVILFPSGVKDQPNTTPERSAEIADPEASARAKAQAEKYVAEHCTWRALLDQ